jgi:hypothetical protein
MDKLFEKACRRTFDPIGDLVSFACWSSPEVLSSDSLKYPNRTSSEALKSVLTASIFATEVMIVPCPRLSTKHRNNSIYHGLKANFEGLATYQTPFGEWNKSGFYHDGASTR